MNKVLKKQYLGVYGICKIKDSILMIKKARGPYIGLYDLPGGGIDFGKNAVQCLKREIMEETGGSVLKAELFEIGNYVCQYSEPNGKVINFHHTAIYYIVELNFDKLKSEPDGQDSAGALFVPIKNLNYKNVAPIAYPVIKNYL